MFSGGSREGMWGSLDTPPSPQPLRQNFFIFMENVQKNQDKFTAMKSVADPEVAMWFTGTPN